MLVPSRVMANKKDHVTMSEIMTNNKSNMPNNGLPMKLCL